MSKMNALPFQRQLSSHFKSELEKLKGLIEHLGELTVVTVEDADHVCKESQEGMRLMSWIGANAIIWKSAGEAYHKEKQKGGVLCDVAHTESISVSPSASSKHSVK